MGWDATCTDTLAPFTLHETCNRNGAASEAAEKTKSYKSWELGTEHSFDRLVLVVGYGYATYTGNIIL